MPIDSQTPKTYVWLPMYGYKAFNEKKERFIILIKTKMGDVASFSVSRDNGLCQKTHRPQKPIQIRFQGNSIKIGLKQKCCQHLAAILIIGEKLKF